MIILKVLFAGFLALCALVAVSLGLAFVFSPDIPDHINGEYLYRTYKEDIELVWEQVSQEGVEGLEYDSKGFQPSDNLIAIFHEKEDSEDQGEDVYQRYKVRYTSMRTFGDTGVVILSRFSEEMRAVIYRLKKDGDILTLCFVDPGPPATAAEENPT